MEGLWFKECTQGRRFIIKISPGESIIPRLVDFAQAMDVRYSVVVSAVGSVKNVTLRGIKSGARLPVTEHRVNIHELEGPLELLSLEGNIIPGEGDALDSHLHILAGKSSGEVIGGHLYHAAVFASCEVILNELHAEGIERHFSKSGGVSTIFIDEEAGV